MPKKVKDLITRYVEEYELIEIQTTTKVTHLSTQRMLEVQERQKLDALCFIIDQSPDFYGIVFCRTKHGADRIGAELKRNNHAVARKNNEGLENVVALHAALGSPRGPRRLILGGGGFGNEYGFQAKEKAAGHGTAAGEESVRREDGGPPHALTREGA